jgi:protein transport protein DSL1/ZW10
MDNDALQQQIHDRIHADLPEFEHQFTTSKSVQTRLRTLTRNVDDLQKGILDKDVRIAVYIATVF